MEIAVGLAQTLRLWLDFGKNSKNSIKIAIPPASRTVSATKSDRWGEDPCLLGKRAGGAGGRPPALTV